MPRPPERTGRLDGVQSRDRSASLGLLAAAAITWLVVLYFFTTRSPVGQPLVQAAGAVLLGAAVAVTVMPLIWLAVFAVHHGIAYRGDWLRAIRRSALVGCVAMILVSLVVLGAVSLPLALFIIALAVFVELILTTRR